MPRHVSCVRRSCMRGATRSTARYPRFAGSLRLNRPSSCRLLRSWIGTAPFAATGDLALILLSLCSLARHSRATSSIQLLSTELLVGFRTRLAIVPSQHGLELPGRSRARGHDKRRGLARGRGYWSRPSFRIPERAHGQAWSSLIGVSSMSNMSVLETRSTPSSAIRPFSLRNGCDR